jgi:AraC-like DNA-binding protein
MSKPANGTNIYTGVVRYAPAQTQRLHRDEKSKISVLLRGKLSEDSAWASTRLAAGDILIKSREVAHEDCFGPSGATVLAVSFSGDDQECPFRAARLDGAWLALKSQCAQSLAVSLAEAAAAGDDRAIEALAHDVMASVLPLIGRSAAPAWLVRLHHELSEQSLGEVDIAACAKKAGRHPVTASREFKRHFGMTITEHAMRQSVRRALVSLVHSDDHLAEVALSAGFYDQSHMNRMFKRITGRTPGAHRELIASATVKSVQ